MKRSLMGCGCATLALAAAGFGVISSSDARTNSQSSATTAKAKGAPIQVLSIGDTSGATANFGAAHYAGLLAAANYVNATGGIDGRKIVITHIDDGGTPAASVSDAIKALTTNRGKYTMVDAGSEGTEDVALFPVMKKYDQFAMTLDDTGGCASASNCPTEFVVKGNPSHPAAAAANFLKHKGIKRVGILEESIAFTESETPGMQAALKADGISSTVVAFPATAVDVTPEMQQLKNDGVKAVFAEALGPPAGYALTARAKLSWSVPIVFDVAGSAIDITKLAPKSELDNVYTDVWGCQDPRNHYPGLPLLFKYAPAKYHATLNTTACDLAATGWDEIILLQQAAKQAPSLTTSALAHAMENLPPAAQSDPLYIASRKKRYTTNNHENVAETPNDFVTIPVGPLTGGVNHPLSW